MLPILHLNGFKIHNPTILSRISHGELESFFRGCGWEPRFVEGDDPKTMHQTMAAALDWAIREIKRIQANARTTGDDSRPTWPMIVLRSPKGWTGPKEVDGATIEGSFRAHQVPIDMSQPHHLQLLESWLRSYKPEELFTDEGKLRPELQALAPKGDRRMGANPHANGGKLLRELKRPDFRAYGIDVPSPGSVEAQDMLVLGSFVRDVIRDNADAKNFRVFGPDESKSNRLTPMFETTSRVWNADLAEGDEYLGHSGRVMDSMLSEHMCEGWLEGYLLTGRHGFFNSYEAFIRIVDSMFSQHAKWLKTCNELPWRQDIASLKLYPLLQRLAAGSQRLHPPGPRLPGSCGQQEGRCGADVSAPGRQLPALLLQPLHCQPELCECAGHLQASPPSMADHGAGGEALHPGHRHLAVGLQ